MYKRKNGRNILYISEKKQKSEEKFDVTRKIRGIQIQKEWEFENRIDMKDSE